MKRKHTVTIGIAAYNEAENIEAMLHSILSQEQKSVQIKKILVVSDGSSDATVKIARSINDRRIQVIAHTTRLGKSSRLNEIFRSFLTDFVVILDADNVFANKKAIGNIIKPFKRDSKIGVVAGNTIPVQGRTFLEKAINNYIFARQSLQHEYNFGKKALVAHAYLAFSRKYGKNFTVPESILNDDAYSYFDSRSKGYKFSYAHDSIVYYRSSSQIKEYIKQATRHIAGGRQLGLLFGDKVVSDGFSVPFPIMKKIMLYQVQRNIIGYFLLKALFSYCRYKSKKAVKTVDTRWEYVMTTKQHIAI